MARLADHPVIGRPVEELDAGFREKVLPFGNGAYVVLYRVQLDDVVILAIRHGKEAGYQPFP